MFNRRIIGNGAVIFFISLKPLKAGQCLIVYVELIQTVNDLGLKPLKAGQCLIVWMAPDVNPFTKS